MPNQPAPVTLLDDEVLAEIKQQLALLRYGSLEISVHNGQVVQLERREKKRWEKATTPNPAR
ncbi:MAG TPA: YezD family protein [Cellvibrionaceae bacterium]|nr:YezD family protein [Cellvibrionaceae bacterium]